MTKAVTYRSFRILTALVWLVNGLFCKVLHLVPRHEQIVSRILGSNHAGSLTIFIGILEVGMAVWVITNIKAQINTVVQIILIGTMNTIELIYAPDLLLWGKFNSLFALIFILLIYLNEFKLKPSIIA